MRDRVEGVKKSVDQYRTGGLGEASRTVRWGLSLPWTLRRGARVALRKAKIEGVSWKCVGADGLTNVVAIPILPSLPSRGRRGRRVSLGTEDGWSPGGGRYEMTRGLRIRKNQRPPV